MSAYTKQYHAYRQIFYGSDDSKNLSVPVYVPFKVKKAKFDFAYSILSSTFPNIIVSSPLTNNDIIGCLNRYSNTSALEAYVTPAQFLAANIENTQLLTTSVPIAIEYLNGNLPEDTTASISVANFNAAVLSTQTDPIVKGAGNIPVDYSYPTLSAYVTPAQFLAADCTDNAGELEVANIIVCTMQTGVIDVDNFEIKTADFAAAHCTNANPSVMGEAAGMTVTFLDVRLPAGTTAVITKAHWDELKIDGSLAQVVLPSNLPITVTILPTTAYITQAQFNAVVVANTNNPVSIAGNMEVTLNNAAEVDNVTTLQLTPADFLAANIYNRIYQNLPMAITLEDSDAKVLQSNVTYYFPITEFNSAGVDKNATPLTLPNLLTKNIGTIPVVMPTANFNGKNIANTTNPLAIAGNMALTINGGANMDVHWANDGFSEDKAFSYIFKDPIDVNGSIYFNFHDTYTGNNIIFANISIHMEFLG